jgi:hypothetical protein
MRLTVGPLPPSVYWRRRALVLAGALLVLFLVAQACMAATASPDGGVSQEGTPPPTTPPAAESPTAPATAAPPDQPDATETADPPPAPPAGTGDQCEDDEMLVTAEAERTSFAAGEQVRFTIRIRNSSNRACVRDIGGDLRELYLIQGTGANKVWSTQHCGGPTGSEERELPPNFVTTYYIDFDGRTSTSCDADDQPAGPRVTPGSYQLFARLGTVYSEPLALTIG